jgi:hypothetical protein
MFYNNTYVPYIQGESKKTETFVIHLNIKCISFFLLTLYYISYLSCQRQLTTKWKLGLIDEVTRAIQYKIVYSLVVPQDSQQSNI